MDTVKRFQTHSNHSESVCKNGSDAVMEKGDDFFYLGFYIAFNTVQVISRRVVGRAEETSTYSSLGFCTVNCRPTASNYQHSNLRPCLESNPGLRGGRRECYHSATVAPEKGDDCNADAQNPDKYEIDLRYCPHHRQKSTRG